MLKIVHLDLKGAPLKVPYLEKVFQCIKSWGATGVLLEWEDTFPYHSELEVIGSIQGCGGDGMYSRHEVTHLLHLARQYGLEPIQLIQTIGHMEFVLKHSMFQVLRENPRSASSLCPSQVASQRLVRSMLSQALLLQPDATYIHIGADEVWCLGACQYCRERSQSNGTASLYLEHLRNLALWLKEQRPEVTVLFWDDMLRSLDVETLRAYDLGSLLQPVVWHYYPLQDFAIDRRLLDTYSQIFPCVWAGSAFKGANGSCRMTSPISRYHGNHVAWLNTIQNNPRVNFRGIILTGWSRFDHYATLCELLPVSLPSLASCLKLLTKFDDTKQVSTDIDTIDARELPGGDIALCIESYANIRQRITNVLDGDHVATWLNPWQLKYNYTNPAQIEPILRSAEELLNYAESFKSNIETNLHEITGKRSIDEWIDTNCTSVINRLKELCAIARRRSVLQPGIEPRANALGDT